MDSTIEKLCIPLSAEAPCGTDLEDTQLLAAFDAYRLFGQMSPLSTEINWREIRDKALEALAQSKDLRLLAHLAAAQLRLAGLAGFAEALTVAGRWFAEFPETLFPRVDEDAILRKNALNAFADGMAIIDALRRQPIVSNPQLGAFSLRHFDIAAGRLAVTEADGTPPSQAQLSAVLAAATPEQIGPMEASLGLALDALQQIEESMRTANGYEAAPDFGPLLDLLKPMRKILADELALRAANAMPAGAEGSDGSPDAGAVIGVGSIKSREDAMRALDAVIAFFRKNEPSSPVPLFVERARRLISKDFLEVLTDIAPDGLSQAKLVGGIRDEE
jgi:type VI secretion system protein ImpA